MYNGHATSPCRLHFNSARVDPCKCNNCDINYRTLQLSLFLEGAMTAIYTRKAMDTLRMRAASRTYSVAKGGVPSIHRFKCIVRSSTDDTPGVQSLLARDRKGPKLQPELLDDVEVTSESSKASSKSSRSARIVGKSKRAAMAKASGAVSAEEVASVPKRCKEAIDAGLELFKAKEYQQAVDMFKLALELPGNGAFRLPTSPREYSCPSDAEEHAALYNMACAHAQLGNSDSALICLKEILDSGFSDYKAIRTDPDLQCLGPGLNDLVSRYDSPVAQAMRGVKGTVDGLFSKEKQMVSDTTSKPWILW